MEKKTRPFGVLDQVGYVCGDMAGSFVNLFVDAYFLTFCTYVLGISPAWMATLFLVARLWDAINDPPSWVLSRTAGVWERAVISLSRGSSCS